MKKILLSVLLMTAIGCYEKDSNEDEFHENNIQAELPLDFNGIYIEEDPIANRTQIVVESNTSMTVTQQNSDSILSYSIINIGEHTIELSDNLADTNNNLLLDFNFSDDAFVIENFNNDGSKLKFKKK